MWQGCDLLCLTGNGVKIYVDVGPSGFNFSNKTSKGSFQFIVYHSPCRIIRGPE
jgi:hypothetical protein